MAPLFVSLAAAAQVPRDTPAQPPATGTAIVRGRVTQAGTSRPLRGVSVSLTVVRDRNTGRFECPCTTTTDDDGRFELTGIPAARYTAVAARSGFVTWQYGQQRPNGTGRIIALEDGQTADRIDVALPRAGAIAGRLVDEAGDAVTGATVQVLRQRYVSGAPRFVSAPAITDRTDDRGEFRVHGLAPGSYVLSATVARRELPMEIQSPGGPGSLVSFYPGTFSADGAQVINLGPGQEVSGVTMLMAVAPLATISGTVRMPDGSPAAVTSVGVAQPYPFSIGRGYSGTSAPVRPDGSFVIRDLPPGPYTVDAQNLPQRDLTASAFVVLDGRDVVVPLVLGKGAGLRGRITFGTSKPPVVDLRLGLVGMETVDPSDVSPGGLAQVNDDWTFEIARLTGQRRFRVTPPPGWWLSSIRLRDSDITDAPLDFSGGDIDGVEIRLTDRPTEVRGVVRDADGQPAAGATVVLLATDPARWGSETRFVAVTQPDQTGRFAHLGLPPERYVAVAVDFLEQGEETNPQTLERLRSLGTPLTLVEGEPVNLDLRVVPAP